MAIQYADNQGVRIAYEVLGDRPTTIIASLCPDQLIEEVLARPESLYRLLARKHRLVLFDLRGVGASGRDPNDDYSAAARASDLLAVLDALGAEQTVALGNCLGAGGILHAVAAQPSRFSHLILANSLAGDGSPPMFHEAALNLLRASPAVYAAQMANLTLGHEASPEERAAIRQRYRRHGAEMARLQEEDYYEDFRPLADKVRCPTLVILTEPAIEDAGPGPGLPILPIPGQQQIVIGRSHHLLYEADITRVRRTAAAIERFLAEDVP